MFTLKDQIERLLDHHLCLPRNTKITQEQKWLASAVRILVTEGIMAVVEDMDLIGVDGEDVNEQTLEDVAYDQGYTACLTFIRANIKDYLE